MLSEEPIPKIEILSRRRHGMSIRAITVADLMLQLEKARRQERFDLQLERAILGPMLPPMLDETGYLPLEIGQAELFFHVIVRLYYQGSGDPDREPVVRRLESQVRWQRSDARRDAGSTAASRPHPPDPRQQLPIAPGTSEQAAGRFEIRLVARQGVFGMQIARGLDRHTPGSRACPVRHMARCR